MVTPAGPLALVLQHHGVPAPGPQPRQRVRAGHVVPEAEAAPRHHARVAAEACALARQVMSSSLHPRPTCGRGEAGEHPGQVVGGGVAVAEEEDVLVRGGQLRGAVRGEALARGAHLARAPARVVRGGAAGHAVAPVPGTWGEPLCR